MWHDRRKRAECNGGWRLQGPDGGLIVRLASTGESEPHQQGWGQFTQPADGTSGEGGGCFFVRHCLSCVTRVS